MGLVLSVQARSRAQPKRLLRLSGRHRDDLSPYPRLVSRPCDGHQVKKRVFKRASILPRTHGKVHPASIVSSLDAPGFVDSVTALDPIGHCRLRYAVLDVLGQRKRKRSDFLKEAQHVRLFSSSNLRKDKELQCARTAGRYRRQRRFWHGHVNGLTRQQRRAV